MSEAYREAVNGAIKQAIHSGGKVVETMLAGSMVRRVLTAKDMVGWTLEWCWAADRTRYVRTLLDDHGRRRAGWHLRLVDTGDGSYPEWAVDFDNTGWYIPMYAIRGNDGEVIHHD